MGCDIHAYIDVDYGDEGRKQPYVKNFASVHISRDYLLFAHMAGVRDWNNTVEHVSEPKGLPEHNSYHVDGEYTLFVINDDEYNNDESCCSRSHAEEWVKEGSSEWVDDHRVTHPDWHSPSWLSLEELYKVRELYLNGEEIDYEDQKKRFKEINKEDPKFKEKMREILDNPVMVPRFPNQDLEGIIGAMEALKSDKCNPRLVFWFDN